MTMFRSRLLLGCLLLLGSSCQVSGRRLPLAAPSVLSSPFIFKQQRTRGRSSLHAYGESSDQSEVELVARRRRNNMRLYPTRQLRGMRKPNEGSNWTGILIMLNVAVFAAQSWFPGLTPWGMKYSDRILRGEELYRLFTPMFLHGNIGHLLTNLYSLSNMGPNVERYFGAGRFLSMYVTAGVVGNIFSAYCTPNPSLGASGAVFGVLGAYFTFLSRNDELFGSYGEAVTASLASTVGINVFFGLISPAIDNWAHFGGFVGGAAMAYLFGPRLLVVGLQNGGTAIIDDPIVRLPPQIESIPGKIGEKIDSLKGFMKQQNILPADPKPWKEKPSSPFQQRDAPPKSIRPRAR